MEGAKKTYENFQLYDEMCNSVMEGEQAELKEFLDLYSNLYGSKIRWSETYLRIKKSKGMQSLAEKVEDYSTPLDFYWQVKDLNCSMLSYGFIGDKENLSKKEINQMRDNIREQMDLFR